MELWKLDGLLDGQCAGRATCDAALEKLTEEFQSRGAAWHHAQQHEQQRYDLCHRKEHRKGGTLLHECKVEGHRQTGTIRDGCEQSRLGEHLLEERLKAD